MPLLLMLVLLLSLFLFLNLVFYQAIQRWLSETAVLLIYVLLRTIRNHSAHTLPRFRPQQFHQASIPVDIGKRISQHNFLLVLYQLVYCFSNSDYYYCSYYPYKQIQNDVKVFWSRICTRKYYKSELFNVWNRFWKKYSQLTWNLWL